MPDGLQVPQQLAKSEDCDGPDLIYLPEVPFDVEKFLAKVKDLLNKKSIYCNRSFRGNQAGRRKICM